MPDNFSHDTRTQADTATQPPTKQVIVGHIQAFVIWEQRPISFKELSTYLRDNAGLDLTMDEIKQHCYEILKSQTDAQPLGFIVSEDAIEAAITPTYRKALAMYEEKGLEGDLGKAGVETLALILYERGATRRRVEYVRGVNCQFVLRLLMSRGYVNRTQKEGERSPIYIATPEALAYFGIKSAEELPNYKAIAESLAQHTEQELVETPAGGSADLNDHS